jgi:hypothetical protein
MLSRRSRYQGLLQRVDERRVDLYIVVLAPLGRVAVVAVHRHDAQAQVRVQRSLDACLRVQQVNVKVVDLRQVLDGLPDLGVLAEL